MCLPPLPVRYHQGHDPSLDLPQEHQFIQGDSRAVRAHVPSRVVESSYMPATLPSVVCNKDPA